jgi:pyocin large subunit-like protein
MTVNRTLLTECVWNRCVKRQAVAFTWEQDDKGNPVPHGWHTPPGKDMVRVRKMEWDSSRKAYTFTTEEDPRITIIWTPDSSGVNVPSNTGNQNQVRIPNPVIVDPLPEDTSIEATTSPAPEEKNLRIIFLFCQYRIFHRFMFI